MADTVIHKLEHSPLPRIIERLGVAISDAQLALDRNAVETFKQMAETRIEIGDQEPSMIELGLIPSFYHFTESRIEARVAFSMMKSREVSVSASLGVTIKVFTATVDASYTSKYSFQSEGSSVVTTRIVTVPPPSEITALIAELKSSS